MYYRRGFDPLAAMVAVWAYHSPRTFYSALLFVIIFSLTVLSLNPLKAPLQDTTPPHNPQFDMVIKPVPFPSTTLSTTLAAPVSATTYQCGNYEWHDDEKCGYVMEDPAKKPTPTKKGRKH